MKLKVGDIEMDSGGTLDVGDGVALRVSSTKHGSTRQSVASHATYARVTAEERLHEPSFDVRDVPVLPRTVILVQGALGLVAGLGALLAVSNGIPGVLPVAVLGLIQGPIAMATLYVISRHIHQKREEQRQLEALRGDAKRVSDVLRLRDMGVTASELATELQVDEAFVVGALNHLLRAGSVEEDVDIESGRFIYRLSDDEEFYLDPDHRSVTERISETQHHRAITHKENA